MRDFGGSIIGIFGAVITLAIISVIISKKSRAPEAIQSLATGLAQVVAAAVNPASSAATNGNLGANSFSTPAFQIPFLP